MNCSECVYSHGNSYNYCFCLLCGVIVYQHGNFECSVFKPSNKRNETTKM